MASTNKTENLGLNLWDGTDRPQRVDFNSDNMLIDEALGSHIDNTSLHLTETEKARVKRPVQNLSYMGSGESTATVTLPLVPSMVLVFCEGKPHSVYDSTKSCTKVYCGMAVYGAGATSGVTLEGGTLKVSQDSQAASGAMNCFNESGLQYKVIIIR